MKNRKQISKKFLAILLVMCICLPSISFPSFGAEILEGGITIIQPPTEFGASYDAMVWRP